MGTKNRPGRFDCYAKADPDEPLFVLLARDPLAPLLVDFWAMLNEAEGLVPSKTYEARGCAMAMRRWRRDARSPALPVVHEPGCLESRAFFCDCGK